MQAAAARRRRPFARRHPVVAGLAATALVLLAVVGVSVGRALTGPGTDSVSARLAEWGRDHHLGTVVTLLERRQYAAHKPRTGGSVPGGIPRAAAPVGVNGAAPPRSGADRVPHSAAPPDVRVLAGTPIPDEGRWQTVVTVKGQPAVRVAYVRPDQVHTSYLVGVMWLDPALLSARLHPGLQDPGGHWTTPSSVTPALQHTAAAAFNGGFRLYQSRGGYYADGRTVRPLRDGAASVVITGNGRLTVGAWGRDVRMSPDVVAVRQNLELLVDGSAVNPTCTQNNTPVWGYTLGNRDFVPRSGLGVTATGAVVFVSGPSLSVCSLGRALAAAGVVRGMELDINAQWMTGAYYQHASDGAILPRKLYPTEARPADHYLTGPSTRDFFAWYARP